MPQVADTAENTPLLPYKKNPQQDIDDLATVNDVDVVNVGTSSISATVFNFTNSIVGAGCIALGSAIAKSGGLVSIAAISFFALLNKYSFDLVISLSRDAAAATSTDTTSNACSGTNKQAIATTIAAASSYESLGHHAYGPNGRMVVSICKLVYSYGSLVAYIKIVKDNFSSAVVQLYYMSGVSPSSPMIVWVDHHQDIATILVGFVIIFPICLLRNMSGLEKCSVVKVAIIFSMLFTMIYLWATSDYVKNNIEIASLTTHEKWFEIRPWGLFKSLGSYVFTFVSQHTINLTYESLKPELQTMRSWKVVSTFSTLLSAFISLAIGLVLYMTFWTDTSSDIFSLYSAQFIPPVAMAKLLLSIMIMFTYPVTFLACRELCIPSSSLPSLSPSLTQQQSQLPLQLQLQQPTTTSKKNACWWLLEHQQTKQLIAPLHVALTFVLWASTTILAILAPSLLDVLNLVGSATGTLIAFVLPALFSYRMRGYTHLATLLLVVGGSIGISGTYFSLVKLV